MLAFLGAIICIIASVHPATRTTLHGSENESVSAPGAEGLGALHGAETMYGGRPGHRDSFVDLASSRPHTPQTFSQFLCTPLALECPSSSPQDAPRPPGEDLAFLQITAEQLRQTVLQQKEQIVIDQEAIRELTGKLSQCENGLELSFQDSTHIWEPRKDTMGDLPLDSPEGVQEMEEAVRTLKDRIEKIEQEIQQRLHNASSTSSTAHVARDSLHSKMEELEGELLTKLLELEKERSSTSSDSSKQHQSMEKDLNVLQNRITELEKGEGVPPYALPDGYKVTFPVRTNYMYARMKKTLPQLYAFTMCLWLKSKASNGVGTPFSYSVTGQPNEIVLLEWGHNPMELLINDKITQLPLSLKDGQWHHICISWTTRDGIWAAFQDGEKRGSSENLSAWHPIKSSGVIILGQEQDVVGGRFDATQAFVGEIAQLNMWDRILTPAEILGIANCTNTLSGNMIQWDDKQVEVFGGASKRPFKSCEERSKP
ncbi:neuronal pentraxin receptor [Rhinatrema bivittatum]|uniref:neuronal pentraxin receptor n=1 Tax=Rhinatrema bivittatum TaxID=194408 RepID=UPI00112A1FA6|nr:neuronal pentraxin receptor [Rhinatrema bivittatum]